MVRKLVIQLTIMSVLMAVALFWPAGTMDWPGAWILLGEYLIVGLALCLWLLRYDPALLRERLKIGFQKEQIFWDKVFIVVLQVIFFGWLVLMAFDAKRWALSHLPEELNVAGAVLIPIGFFVIWLTFRENTFAAAVIKIQKERGQTVVTTGPYRWVRHPMYAGATLYMIGTPLLLGSWIGLTVLPLLIGAMMLRIPMEERALRKGLLGYDEYAARVRYRLVPYIW
jgi:protein-S-isoprenylcysteine O-methyltransferase Ste14